MAKIFGNLTSSLSNFIIILLKNLFKGIYFVFAITPPEFKKVKNSEKLWWTKVNLLSIFLLNFSKLSKIKFGKAIFADHKSSGLLHGMFSLVGSTVKLKPSCLIRITAN